MASLATLEQRIRALEARLAEVEGGYGNTLYRFPRDSVGTRIDWDGYSPTSASPANA